ncbi:MAG: hypothetical protein IJL89_10465 [Firmicutes bacterium]|nr:hypothetical protein [Bacillota bacterium]
MTSNSKKTRIVFIILLIAQVCLYVYTFSQKNAFLTDEFYTYGLSNSYYKPFLCSDGWHSYKNNVWLTGADFKYYLRTNKDTNFKFDSVISNLSKDTTPPLYYLALHAVSSVFTGYFSWWWSFWINIFCFIAAQILLYKIFDDPLHPSKLPLYICGFWGFTLSALYPVVYVRMYSMLDMFVFLYIYLLKRCMQKQSLVIKDFFLILSAVILGGLTHYLFFLFAFFYTGCCCVYLLLKKHFKMLALTAFSALSGVLAAFLLFPAAARNIFAPLMVWKSQETFLYKFYMIFRLAAADITGIKLPYDMPDAVTAVLIIIIAALSVFAVIKFIKNGTPYVVFVFISSAAYFVYICNKTAYEQFGIAIDRYIFVVLPLFIGCAAVFSRRLISGMPKYAKYAAAALLFISAASQNIFCFKPYAEHFNSANGSINKYVVNKNCIMIEPLEIYLPSYGKMLENARNVFVTSHNGGMFLDEKYDLAKEYEKIYSGQDCFYVAVDMLNLNEDSINYGVLPYFSGISGYTPTFCTNEKVQGSEVRLYRFDRE